MSKKRILVVALTAMALTVSLAAASDVEWSPRHLALADTGNAIFNTSYFPPVYENIAAACESNKFYIAGESRTQALYGLGKNGNSNYNMLLVNAGGGVKSAFPLGEDNEDDWTGRAGLIFELGHQTQFLRTRKTNTDTNLELTDSRLMSSPAIRIGAAYGFHQIFAMGLGFTMYPTAVSFNSFKGTQDTKLSGSNVKFEDTWTITGPFMITPEIGFLFRTEDGMQFGLNYELGYTAHNKQSPKHETAEGDFRYDTELAVVRPNNLGVGWAYMIPNVDKFFVGFDLDVYFRQAYEGDSYDPRDLDRKYFVRDTEKSKDDPFPNEPIDPNGDVINGHQYDPVGNRYYASTNARYVFSASVEKSWDTVGLRGGLGYSSETGLDRDRPVSTFFMTVGPTLLFDETIFMTAGARMDIGFARAETSYFVFGGGGAVSLGGTF